MFQHTCVLSTRDYAPRHSSCRNWGSTVLRGRKTMPELEFAQAVGGRNEHLVEFQGGNQVTMAKLMSAKLKFVDEEVA